MAKFVIGTSITQAVPAFIPGGYSERYGLSLDNFIGKVDANGQIISIGTMPSISFDGVESIGASAIQYAFCHKTFVASQTISFPDLTTINGNKACYHTFDNITNAGTGSSTTNGIVDMSSLTSISGTSACEGMFYQAMRIKEFRFTNLTSISGNYACKEMFYNCPHFTTISFPALTTVSNSNAFTDMFMYTNLTAIHFRADARSVIEGLDFYSSRWGASSATIYFDL
jgi:hypothetical protein